MLLLHRLNVAHPKLHNNVKLATLDAYELNIVVKPTPFPKKEKRVDYSTTLVLTNIVDSHALDECMLSIH